MSRNTSTGAYTLPSGSFKPAVDGTVISATDWNTLVADLEAALSYEYGTFTPTLAGSSVAGSPTYATQAGIYRVIGDLVYYWAYISVSSLGTASGDIVVGGLPYTVTASRDAPAANAVINNATWSGQMVPNAVAGATTVKFYLSGAGALTFMQISALSSNASILVSGWYKK